MKKGLEKNSKYNKYDINSDGVVTDEELSIATSIKETEQLLRKQLAQLRIARATLIAMGLFTVAMFFVDIERLKALADISNLFYISGAGIVGAYMGASAFMSKK
jgi:hypothetical protein|tara:strand:+ start:2852 stop:3163 length:312 start_codon:yes stop_codon:yes gene_type:complete